ncbi:MAG: hypothetical protein ACK4G4_10390 [Thermus sp.]|uniref:hypothetical protein n=1 Tax=Thermus sp. TaxID=275 RepID=UPI00391DA96D
MAKRLKPVSRRELGARPKALGFAGGGTPSGCGAGCAWSFSIPMGEMGVDLPKQVGLEEVEEVKEEEWLE